MEVRREREKRTVGTRDENKGRGEVVSCKERRVIRVRHTVKSNPTVVTRDVGFVDAIRKDGGMECTTE